MSSTLAEKTLTMLEDLPPYLGSDPSTQAVLDPVGIELQRLEDQMVRLRTKMLPQNADDEFRTLGMWESLMGVAVEPAGVSVTARRNLIVSHLRKRLSGASSDWVANVTEVLGSIWTWQLGPGPYAITVHISYASGTVTAGQVADLLRDMTPAHIDLHVGYGEGFLVGISQIGIESL